MLAGWLICAILGGGLHLLYLGRPLRFWRILISSGWKSSWLARGLYFVTLFLIMGAIYIFLAQRGWAPAGLLAATDFFAFLAIIYLGFVMSSVNGIPLWNTPLLVILYAILGIWGGAGVLLLLGTALAAKEWVHIFLASYAFILAVYLVCIRYQGGATGKISVQQIVVKKWALLFWIVSVVLGIVFPGVVGAVSWASGWEVPATLGNISIICELLGDLALRYCILKCALYPPVIPAPGYAS
jgi:formate-dependent nitrite reductase membrane component NrfD